MIALLLAAIAEGVSGERAWGSVAALHATECWSSCDRYAQTSEWCAEQFRTIGLEVERVSFPADGKTRFGDWMMPLAWDAKEARL